MHAVSHIHVIHTLIFSTYLVYLTKLEHYYGSVRAAVSMLLFRFLARPAARVDRVSEIALPRMVRCVAFSRPGSGHTRN